MKSGDQAPKALKMPKKVAKKPNLDILRNFEEIEHFKQLWQAEKGSLNFSDQVLFIETS